MRRFITLIFILLALSEIFGQRPSLTLTFSAVNNTTWVQLDSIKVMNRTQSGDTVLYYPDTVLVLDYQVGIPEPHKTVEGFQVFQNYPNPVADQTTINLYVPSKDNVSLTVTDVLGRVVIRSERVLDEGLHSFRFTPGGGSIFFFTARWRRCNSTIKIIQADLSTNGACSLEYLSSKPPSQKLKATETVQSFLFSIGDTLLYIGYTGTLQAGMPDSPETSESYTFQFATNIPCPGTPTVEYEGQVYNTIQIFSQCWLKENLNVGTMIQGGEDMTDNGIIEKWCYNNETDSCTKYGGLYQWDEMMQYTIEQGVQGICPPGWHLPDDEEWKVLEGTVDSQYGLGDPEWDLYWGLRGFDAGLKLKSTSGWNSGNGINLVDFSGLPGGYTRFYTVFEFWGIGDRGEWWASTKVSSSTASKYSLYSVYPTVCRIAEGKGGGESVRCIRDEVYIAPIVLSFSAINHSVYVQLDSVKVMNRTQGCDTTLFWSDTTLVLQSELPYNAGDELLMIGYSDTFESGLFDSPDLSQTYTFQFATNIPCPGTPTVTYGGQVYNTIQIFSQCWLKENLNVGVKIYGNQQQSDNGTIEKYCYDDSELYCDTYGGLYQWSEMMQYEAQQGEQGICPPGWHLPSDDEWKVLEGAVDSQYGIGDTVWDSIGWRGFDAATNLKSESGWESNGNGTDLYGFSGLPGGFRYDFGNFHTIGEEGYWWTSTELDNNYSWERELFPPSKVIRTNNRKELGFSVRCLKDD